MKLKTKNFINDLFDIQLIKKRGINLKMAEVDEFDDDLESLDLEELDE